MAAGGEAFTLLTTEPSADVAPIHDRQMVVLERSDWSAWLEQTENETDLLTREALATLFTEEHTAADLVKWKDIYDLLEATMDGCETAANVLETMAIKNA